MTREQGWECPKCARVWAPKISACGWCNHSATHEPAKHIPIYRPSHFSPNWNYNGDDAGWMG